MSQPVADIRANRNENILHAVKAIGRSQARRSVFEAIYSGKKLTKTVSEISKVTGLSDVRVLQEGLKLAGDEIVIKFPKAYKKIPFYSLHKNKVLSIFKNPKNTKKYPTKQRPHIQGTTSFKIVVKGTKKPRIQQITVDDIHSFRKIRSCTAYPQKQDLLKLRENKIKIGIQKIIGEERKFKDWGGETNDLFSNKLCLTFKRISAAFALKGRGTKGVLKPNKMGKNGDQIARLFGCPAHVFLIVYPGEIHESILTQMYAFAVGRALSASPIYYGVIGGADFARLYQAYRRVFL